MGEFNLLIQFIGVLREGDTFGRRVVVGRVGGGIRW